MMVESYHIEMVRFANGLSARGAYGSQDVPEAGPAYTDRDAHT